MSLSFISYEMSVVTKGGVEWWGRKGCGLGSAMHFLQHCKMVQCGGECATDDRLPTPICEG